MNALTRSAGIPVSHTPWMPQPYRSPLLEQAVLDRRDEIEAFRDFAITRAGRHVTSTVVGASLGAMYQVSKCRWLRYTIKGVTRFVPVIGWGLLAYDLYNLGEDLDLY